MEVHIEVKLKGNGFPAPEETANRYKYEDLIAERNIGEIVDSGAGMGVMDIFVEVSDAAAAKEAILSIAKELNIEEITTITEVSQDS